MLRECLQLQKRLLKGQRRGDAGISSNRLLQISSNIETRRKEISNILVALYEDISCSAIANPEICVAVFGTELNFNMKELSEKEDKNAELPSLDVEGSLAIPRKKHRATLRKRQHDEASFDERAERPAVQRPKAAPLMFTTRRDTSSTKSTLDIESKKTVQQVGADATRSLDIEDNTKRTNTAGESATDDEYKGLASYRDYREGFRSEDALKRGSAYGPLKGSTNVRMTVRVDYQPDICKDYKETGYCGFGDSCKFLHDRGEYKAGYQLDREWEEKQKAQRERIEAGLGKDDGAEDDGVVDALPFACLICRKPWEECQDPVVTKCGHYFCEQCALKQNAKTSKCFVCQQPTGGIFNVARDILKKIRK